MKGKSTSSPPETAFSGACDTDKHVAAIASGRRINGKTQTPNWVHAHTGIGYSSAPGKFWRKATPEDFSIQRYAPFGASSKGGYLKDAED